MLRFNSRSGEDAEDAKPIRPSRIDVVQAYFSVLALSGAIATATLLLATLWPALGLQAAATNHPWMTIANGILWTFSAIQTSRMLDRRRRLGLVAAGVCFVTALLPSGSVASFSRIPLGAALVGLALVASLWRRLD